MQISGQTHIFLLMSASLKKQSANTIVCAFALLSILLSAVSACACVHHAERAADPSCHSAPTERASHSGHKTHGVHGTHSQHHQDTAAANHDGDLFDAPCNCGNADSITAVTVRGESVRHPAAIRIATADTPQFEYERREMPAAASIPTGHISSYTSLFRTRSGPSRAPPRL